MERLAGLSLLVGFCTAAVICDLRHGRIPNWLNALGCAAGFAAACITGGLSGAASSAAGVLLGLAVLLVPFLLRMVGGGDVKFLAAAGALVGWRLLWMSFLVGALIGGISGIVLWIARDRSFGRFNERLALLRAGRWKTDLGVKERSSHAVTMPYALPLCAGLLMVASFNAAW